MTYREKALDVIETADSVERSLYAIVLVLVDIAEQLEAISATLSDMEMVQELANEEAA